MLYGNKRTNNKLASLSLAVLWLGSVVLLIVMLNNWRGQSKSNKLSVDQLLISSHDLRLGESFNLVNKSLNRDPARKETSGIDTLTAVPDRDIIYSKILKNKMRKISAVPKSDGLTIKPLPK